MPDPISWQYSWPYLATALVFGYLLGSIPFGIVVTRLAGKTDPRKSGSGNIGATNVLRAGGKGLAAATLLGDMLKGTVAVLAAGIYGPDPSIMAGFGAFIGHLFPVWLKFRGGKGVATYLGILLGMSFAGASVFGAVWLAMAAIFRFSSLAALVAVCCVPVYLYVTGNVQIAEFFAILTFLIIFMHRANIGRLLSGTESKIGNKG